MRRGILKRAICDCIRVGDVFKIFERGQVWGMGTEVPGRIQGEAMIGCGGHSLKKLTQSG